MVVVASVFKIAFLDVNLGTSSSMVGLCSDPKSSIARILFPMRYRSSRFCWLVLGNKYSDRT